MSDIYENPLCARYASKEMQFLFSPDFKFSTWRRLWIALAESEQELGLPISDQQLAQMREHITDIDYELAAEYERKLRHDVMAHIRTYGEACPLAKPVIHLGATSCYVGDNTDIIQMRKALELIKGRLLGLISNLADFAEKWKDTPVLSYTHFQAAQPSTLGKRACIWLQDFMLDYERLIFELGKLRLLGCKGTTGTSASFLELFGGDKVKPGELEKKIAEKMGFDACMPISGQTYTRKVDSFIINILAGIGQSASKMATDLRLMAHMKELDEPFESEQVGSSAMAYKRNPMRCERIVSLSRHIESLCMNTAATSSNQWLERTLDDSANRRISIPEAFLAADAVLLLCINVIKGAMVYPKAMERHLRDELPFIATENILMHGVSQGGDRQELHELIRQYSQQAALRVKAEGEDNDLLDRLKADERFGLNDEILDELLDIRKFIGLAPEQTESYLEQYVRPVLADNRGELSEESSVRV
ncbi:MAG: adenylosuccinate lyase [Oscillospiraceae bacterium]|nr:adenylosuccinate lyase [Oscillospiraceae bacterium]